jgi:hypothetical protein
MAALLEPSGLPRPDSAQLPEQRSSNHEGHGHHRPDAGGIAHQQGTSGFACRRDRIFACRARGDGLADHNALGDQETREANRGFTRIESTTPNAAEPNAAAHPQHNQDFPGM